MVLEGTIINTIAIIIGGLIGSFLSNIPQKIRTTVMQGIALVVFIQGIEMALKTENFLLVIISVVLGGVIGEVLNIENRLEKMGKWIEKRVGNNKGSVATAFVTTTLVYTIGAMAVLGALNSGLNLDHRLLYLKAMLDGISAIIFASTLGIGVIFSAVPVFIYQGLITVMARNIHLIFGQELLNAIIIEITATGGILIIAIAINILEIKKINVGNMLPAMIIPPIGLIIIEWITQILK